MSYLDDFINFIKKLFGNGKTNTLFVSKELVKVKGNDEAKYRIGLYDVNQNPLNNQDVIITINNIPYTKKTNVEGIAELNINLNVGIVQATVEYKGNDKYNGVKTFENIIVNADILTTDLTMDYHDGGQFVANFFDANKKGITNALVAFDINNKRYTRFTDDKGQAKLNINLVPGTYEIKTVAGNQIVKNKITVNKLNTSVDAPNISMAKGDGTTFNAALYNPKDRIYGEPAIFSIAGTDYTFYPGADGIYSSKDVNALNVGEYDIKVTYKGNDIYNPSSTVGHLVVYEPAQKYTGDTNGYYLNPRYLSGDEITQVTDYSCACNSGQQDHYKLTGKVASEYLIMDYMGTTENGTGHGGIEIGMKKLAKDVGKTAKLTWYDFSALGWEEIGRLTEDPNKAILCHNLYRNTWGHYEVFKAVNMNDGVVEVLNSLSGGYIEYRSFGTMQSYINGISQKSILVVEYV